MRVTLAAALVSMIASPALAEEEPGDLDKSEYPMELVKRPLVLADGMLEIELGAMSDFVAANAGGHVATRADISWSPFRRGEIEVESTLLVAGDLAFSIPEVGAFLEYGVHPTMSLRVGGFMTGFRDASDELVIDYGVRAGIPMQYSLGKKAQLQLTPEWSMQVDAETQEIALDSRLAYQVIMPLALYLRLGVAVLDYELASEFMRIPVGVGAVLHPGRFFDLGAELLVVDVGDEAGRDERWMTFWLALRH